MQKPWLILLVLGFLALACDDDPKPPPTSDADTTEQSEQSELDLLEELPPDLLPDEETQSDLELLDGLDEEGGEQDIQDHADDDSELEELADQELDLQDLEDESELEDLADQDAELDEQADQELEDAEDESDVQPWDPRFDPLVAAVQQDLAASNAYGVSVAVMENGVITFAQAFGSKDPNGLEPLTPNTLMQIGSTTKQFTAVALLQKVEDGQIALETTLDAALPGFEFAMNADWDDSITLHDLLSQQSGIYDDGPWHGVPDDSELADYTNGTFANESFLMNPAGVFFNYSNPNFSLAGAITEHLDSRMWPDLMREDVLLPLGMERSFLRKSEVEADGDYALSYGIGTDDLGTGHTGPVAMADMPDPAWLRPAGLLWTTPSQMMLWAKFLMDGDNNVLSDGLRQKLFAPNGKTFYTYGLQHYGYGLFLDPGYEAEDGRWFEMPVWNHGGNTLSFSNFLYILPEQNFAIAICSSGQGNDFYHSIDAAITTLATLPAPSTAPEWVADPALFSLHVGRYQDPYQVGDMNLSLQGNNLMIAMPDMVAAGISIDPRLIPVSSDLFLAIVAGQVFDLAMIPVKSGGATQWVRNRLFVTTRRAKGEDTKLPPEERLRRWSLAQTLRLGPGLPRELRR